MTILTWPDNTCMVGYTTFHGRLGYDDVLLLNAVCPNATLRITEYRPNWINGKPRDVLSSFKIDPVQHKPSMYIEVKEEEIPIIQSNFRIIGQRGGSSWSMEYQRLCNEEEEG